MICENVNSCAEEIGAYFQGEPTGHVLIVNTDENDIYNEIRAVLTANRESRFFSASDFCQPDKIPNPGDICDYIAGEGKFALSGMAQLWMLCGADIIKKEIGFLLQKPIRGHAVILLEHCERELRERMRIDHRTARRIILIPAGSSPLPRIKIAKKQEDIANISNEAAVIGIKNLLSRLEKPTPEIWVITRYTRELSFKDAVYSMESASGGIYQDLIQFSPELQAHTEESFGTETQWNHLAEKLRKFENLTAVAEEEFGNLKRLSDALGSVIENQDRFWLLWICMKVFGVKENIYLNLAVGNTRKYDELEKYIIISLLDIQRENPDFLRYYQERKRLLEIIPESLVNINYYCDHIGKYGKDGVFYLTDRSEREKLEFLRCLENFEYTPGELREITGFIFPELEKYLREFVFDKIHVEFSENEIENCAKLTRYFQEYKIQKVRNKIYPEFLSQVENFARERFYNKISSRSAVLRDLEKNKARLFFFDALGVEYLAYIQAKCEEYGLDIAIKIGRGNLPSITSRNQDFLKYFDRDKSYKIHDLDELKHHSQIYDYQVCKSPIYIFRELEIIDNQLREIQARFAQGAFDTAIVIADHGASRLAVISGQWEPSGLLKLDEKGEHSGRCCPTDRDPELPFVTFERDEQGKYWATLANYQRFQGGRRANAEVHGGATLEEILIPVLIIYKKLNMREIYFINPVIELSRDKIAVLKIYSSHVNNKHLSTNYNHLYILPNIFRSCTISASVNIFKRSLKCLLSNKHFPTTTHTYNP